MRRFLAPANIGARAYRVQSKKPTVCIVGTGWAGARLVRDLDPSLCNIAILSMRNHMVFTPLLPQTCTGTLEFRSICEPILRVQPALAVAPNVFFRTMVYDVDFKSHKVQCVSVGVIGTGGETPVGTFDFHYDYLVFAHGARPNTFNIPGVDENAFFLREISEARGIRRRLVQNIMTAKLPTTSPEERKRLLHVVVVGGGPTGVEFAGDLSDFLREDIPKVAPHMAEDFRITLVEANEILGTFDLTLRNYGASRLQQIGVQLRKAIVAEVTDSSVVLTDGEILNCGLVVWSTGVGPSQLNKALDLDKNKQGRLAVDKFLRVRRDENPLDNVFAIGDCAADIKAPLPTLAAVASRHGKHVATTINEMIKTGKAAEETDAFQYKHLGSMASLGQHTALVEFQAPQRFDFKGLQAFLLWRSAYFTMLGSVRSRLYVMVNWCGSFIFGRDTTYIAEISEAKMWKNLAQAGATKEQARRKLLAQAHASKSASFYLGKKRLKEAKDGKDGDGAKGESKPETKAEAKDEAKSEPAKDGKAKAAKPEEN